jgi:hypothetical protein
MTIPMRARTPMTCRKREESVDVHEEEEDEENAP